jgi:hypothetical protein
MVSSILFRAHLHCFDVVTFSDLNFPTFLLLIRCLTALAVYYYFKPVLVAFDTLQVDGAVIERQYAYLLYAYLQRLIEELREQVSAVPDESKEPVTDSVSLTGLTVSLGQFKVAEGGLQSMFRAISVEIM